MLRECKGLSLTNSAWGVGRAGYQGLRHFRRILKAREKSIKAEQDLGAFYRGSEAEMYKTVQVSEVRTSAGLGYFT